MFKNDRQKVIPYYYTSRRPLNANLPIAEICCKVLHIKISFMIVDTWPSNNKCLDYVTAVIFVRHISVNNSHGFTMYTLFWLSHLSDILFLWLNWIIPVSHFAMLYCLDRIVIECWLLVRADSISYLHHTNHDIKQGTSSSLVKHSTWKGKYGPFSQIKNIKINKNSNNTIFEGLMEDKL